jgi:hypothetical protein
VTRPAALASLALIALLVPSGCGYSFRGTLPPHIRTVGVPIFVNRTAMPTAAALITRAVVQAFSTNGRLTVVNPSEADSILEGEVIGYLVAPTAFDSRVNVRTLRVYVTLNVLFRDVKRNVILFRQVVTERADFQVPGGPTPVVSQTVSEEETALQSAAIDIGRSIVSLAIERF